jgi:hypothetical protein
MIYRIAEEAIANGSTKEKLFGGLEFKLSISDQKSTMMISSLTRPNGKKLRKFLEYIGCPTSGVTQRAMRKAAPHARREQGKATLKRLAAVQTR